MGGVFVTGSCVHRLIALLSLTYSLVRHPADSQSSPTSSRGDVHMKFITLSPRGKARMPILWRSTCFDCSDHVDATVHDDIVNQHCAVVTRRRKLFVSDLDSGRPTFVAAVSDPGLEWPFLPRVFESARSS